MRLRRWYATALALQLLVGCAGLVALIPSVQTPTDKVAAAQLTLKAAYATAADYKARGQLSVASEQAILRVGDELQAAIDATRAVIRKGGSPEAVDAALRLLEARLLALERERTARGVK